MKTTLEKIDELNATLHLTIDPSDFLPEYEKNLKELVKTGNFKGFRPGHVPKSVVEKKYGENMLTEAIINTANQSLNNYLKSENIDILGQPLTSDKQKPIESFSKESSYDFIFEIGLVPKIDINLSSIAPFEKLKMLPSETQIQNEMEHMSKVFGTMHNPEQAGEGDSCTIEITELDDNGEPLVSGMNKGTTLLVDSIKDVETKSKILNCKVNESFETTLSKLFNDDSSELSHALNISKEEAADLTGNFKISLKEVLHVENHPINEELYQKAFGEDCKTEEDFKTRVSEFISAQYEIHTRHMLEHSVMDYLISNHAPPLPDDFMKRWLLQRFPEEYNDTNVDEKYAKEQKGLQWQLIREHFEEEFNISITQDQVNDTAAQHTMNLFAGMGWTNITYHDAYSFAMERMKKPDFKKEMEKLAYSNQFMAALVSHLQVTELLLPQDELVKRIESHNAEHHQHDHHDESAHDHAHDHTHDHEHSH